MRNQRTRLAVVALAIFALVAVVAFFHQRKATLQIEYGQSYVLQNAYDLLEERGPDVAKAYIALNTLNSLRETEDTLSHPTRPWWPRRPRGSYEREFWPFWAWPVPKHRLEHARARLQEFQTQIGVTNEQREIEFKEQLLKLMQREPTTH